MEGWYLVTTKLKSELRVKQNLLAKHGLESFFPVFPQRKSKSATGLPLFPRYVFVRCDIQRDFQKVAYSPGVSKIVHFGPAYTPIPEDVIICLRNRCDADDRILPPDLVRGQKVRVKQGYFEGCEGIIQEKRGNRRIQLLLELAYGPAFKIELASGDVEPLILPQRESR